MNMNGSKELFDSLLSKHPAPLRNPVRVSLIVEGCPLLDRIVDVEVAAEIGTQLALAVSEHVAPPQLIHVFGVPVPDLEDTDPSFPLKLIHSCQGIAHSAPTRHHEEPTPP